MAAKSINVTDPVTGRSAVITYEEIDDAEEQEKNRIARNKKYKLYWQYYDGEQYDKENQEHREYLRLKENQRLPEEDRLHAYSGIIEDGVDFITDQLMEGMGIEVKTEAELKSGEPAEEIPEEQSKFQEMWDVSDMDLEAPDLTREALVSAESYILLKWDEVNQIVKFLPYEAESVCPVYSSINHKRMIMATIYSSQYDAEIDEELEIREQYVLAKTSEGYMECVYLKFTGDNEDPVEGKLLNIGFIPIIHLRAIRKKVRRSFGDSLIKRLIGDTDRYNAVNQHEYQISRYNSGSHLAIFGTESNVEPSQLLLGGEANDCWAFPNTSEVKTMTLPTETAMMDSQCGKLEKNMYRKMGIQKIDLEEIKGMGAPSGYALEIINRKTDGVFTRIQKELSKGYITLFGYALDMQAIMEGKKPWYDTDPLKTYPNRTIKLTFGSVFIADSEAIRQDYVAGLISRKRALMLKGYSELEAQEMAEEAEEDEANRNAAELEGMGISRRNNQE